MKRSPLKLPSAIALMLMAGTANAASVAPPANLRRPAN